MTQGQRYGKPPIEEAVCELRFKSDQDWDFTVPGRLYTKLENEYPGKPRDQKAVAIGLDIQEGSPPNMKYNEGLVGVQLLSKNQKRMVGVGPNRLTIHMLKPYQDPDIEIDGWEDFKSRIEVALNAYWDVAKPEGICRVGIRYINKIIIPGQEADIKEYFSNNFSKCRGTAKKANTFCESGRNMITKMTYDLSYRRDMLTYPKSVVGNFLGLTYLTIQRERSGKGEIGC
ncbi:MAG: TIGR04255 family protein, partial [Synechococcus sp. SB0677_bin_5]|nr:TIGR04255 family protein [Synechococcus sp. SB0677_bin_5]